MQKASGPETENKFKFSWLSNLKEMWWQEKEDMVPRRGKLVEKVTPSNHLRSYL